MRGTVFAADSYETQKPRSEYRPPEVSVPPAKSHNSSYKIPRGRVTHGERIGREQVDEHDDNAILLWREFRNIYDEVTQQSSLPLYLVVREALKNLKQEIANSVSCVRKDAEGKWIITRTDKENIERLEGLTNLFSLTRFLANKTEQVKVDFERNLGLLGAFAGEVLAGGNGSRCEGSGSQEAREKVEISGVGGYD